MSDFETYDDLDGLLGEEFEPQQAIRPGIDALPDGPYEFEVLDAELTKAQNGDRICTLGLRVNSAAIVQHTYWLNRQIGMNRLALASRLRASSRRLSRRRRRKLEESSTPL